MNFTYTLHPLVRMFDSIEEYLTNYQLDLAYSQAQRILSQEKRNLYARTIERRLARILSERSNLEFAVSRNGHPMQKALTALQYICRLAKKRLGRLPEQASIHDMNQQLRQKALEKKLRSMLHRARHLFHVQEDERALRESERALIIQPNNPDALALIEEIKTHITASHAVVLPDKHREQKQKPIASYHQKQLKSPPDEIQKDQTDVISDKILSCISFAEYHRTNKDFHVSLSCIEEGLQHDPANEVLLQMKEEVEHLATAKVSEIGTGGILIL